MFLKNHLKLSQMVVETASGVRLQTGLQEVYLHQVPDVTISSGQTIQAGNSTAAAANNITVDSGGSLTIAKNSDLTLQVILRITVQ